MTAAVAVALSVRGLAVPVVRLNVFSRCRGRHGHLGTQLPDVDRILGS